MTHPRTSALIEHIRQRDGQVGVGLGNAPEEWVTLAREFEDELAEARAVIADLLANAVPVAAESGDAGMVFVEMTEAQWQAVVDATARARAFLAK
jgi:hypothetical protein